MQVLKADTQVKVVIGPVVAVGDGFTPVTTLALTTADEAEAMKHDAAAVTSISGNTFAAITSMDGYYNLTLTAAQLDTEGMLTIGINDDSLCLPVRHDFMVVNANVYDSLYGAATTDYLQVDTLQLGGATQSATDLKDFADAGYDPATNKVQGVVLTDTTTDVTNQVTADMTAISGDTTAADNLELQYDGTGLTGDSYPARQDQVDSIAIGSSSISTVAESYTLTTGTQSSGTFASTETRDGVPHQHTDTAGTLDLYYQFDVGGNGTATDVVIYSYLQGSNDDLTVYAYDWDGAAWDAIGTKSGTNAATYIERTYSLLNRHTGTGANLGKVRVRFNDTGLSSATLSVDQIFTSYAVVAQSVGYAEGAVWIDTVDGTAGTESYVNGVADNPVDTLADALTIGSNNNLSKFRCSPDSSITFASSQPSRLFYGDGWTCALGGQDLSGTHIYHAKMTGTCTSPTAELHVDNSHIGTCSFGGDVHLSHSKLTDTITFTAAGDVILEKCVSEVAGAGSPTIDMGAAVGATNLSVRDWRGGLTLNNLASGDVVTLDGIFGTITLNGADAQVELRGIAKAVTNNLTGSPTVNDNTLKSTDIDAILEDTGTTLPATLSDILTDTGTTLPAQISALNDPTAAAIATEILTTQMTEAYAADGTAPTLAQAIFLIQQTIGDFSISGTTLTAKKLDGTTTAATYTLDDAANPTSRTRAT